MQRQLPVTAQTEQMTSCPLCPAREIWFAFPPLGTIANCISRCMVCMAFWVTSPGGKILRITRVTQEELCPSCRVNLNGRPVEEHICKGER
mgnify:CR=1 FL=1